MTNDDDDDDDDDDEVIDVSEVVSKWHDRSFGNSGKDVPLVLEKAEC